MIASQARQRRILLNGASILVVEQHFIRCERYRVIPEAGGLGENIHSKVVLLDYLEKASLCHHRQSDQAPSCRFLKTTVIYSHNQYW